MTEFNPNIHIVILTRVTSRDRTKYGKRRDRAALCQFLALFLKDAQYIVAFHELPFVFLSIRKKECSVKLGKQLAVWFDREVRLACALFLSYAS
jgi:hypothetical protein